MNHSVIEYYEQNPTIRAIRQEILLDEAFDQDESKIAILKHLFNDEWLEYIKNYLMNYEHWPEINEIKDFFKKLLLQMPLLFTEKGKQYEVDYGQSLKDIHGNQIEQKYILNFLECELLWRASCMDNTQYVCKGEERIYFKNINEILTV